MPLWAFVLPVVSCFIHFSIFFVLMILFIVLTASSDILRLHNKTSLSVRCVMLSPEAPLSCCDGILFFPKCLHIDPKEHHSCWCKTGWLRCNSFIVIFYFLFLYLFIYLFLFWDFQKWRCDLYLKYTMLLLLLQIETMIIHPRMMSLRASSSDILESKRFIKKKKDAWRVCNIRFFMLARDPNNTLCSLLSHSAHWPSATPQWCRPALAFLLACIAWWMRKNDCDISYRFRINASGSNAAPDTLISIFVVTGEHKKGEACAALKNGWGVLLKWLPVYNLVFSQREGIMYSKTLW